MESPPPPYFIKLLILVFFSLFLVFLAWAPCFWFCVWMLLLRFWFVWVKEAIAFERTGWLLAHAISVPLWAWRKSTSSLLCPTLHIVSYCEMADGFFEQIFFFQTPFFNARSRGFLSTAIGCGHWQSQTSFNRSVLVWYTQGLDSLELLVDLSICLSLICFEVDPCGSPHILRSARLLLCVTVSDFSACSKLSADLHTWPS